MFETLIAGKKKIGFDKSYYAKDYDNKTLKILMAI